VAGPDPLTPGGEVVVRTFGHKRGVLVAAGRDGRWQVRVGGVTMWCRREDLGLPPPAKKRRDRRASPRETSEGSPRGTAAAGRLDLHGLTVEDAIARVLDEIDLTLLRGADRLEVVHGKGTGRIRHELHRRLRGMPVVKAFRLDPANAGVTWVFFG
jgi:DNA mismatch repair protein MutS2